MAMSVLSACFFGAPKKSEQITLPAQQRTCAEPSISTIVRNINNAHAPIILDLTLNAPTEVSAHPQWSASLRLRFAFDGRRTILAEREHTGPLRLLKPLYPEGDRCCHAVVVHPPGGVVAGDSLTVTAQVEHEAHGVITTPGAQKWYRTEGAEATSATELAVDSGGALEWLPQETIVFDGARARQTLTINVESGAKFFGWEMVCFGRTASDERFTRGHFRQTIRVLREDALVWSEHLSLTGGDPLLNSPLGWGGYPVSATAWIARDTDSTSDEAFLSTIRSQLEHELLAAASNPVPGLFIIKAVGASAESVRELLIRVWSEVRFEVFGVAAQRPRIWST
jgi:urease accessory protein